MATLEKNQSEVVYSLVYSDTGEVAYELHEGDSIKIDRKEQKEYRANHRKIKQKDKFVKVWCDTISLLAQENFTASQYKIIFVALSYVEQTSGVLVEDGVNISKGRFMELTGLTENTFDTAINRFIKSKIMARTKVGRSNVYLLNPYIFMNGQYINDTLFRIFHTSKWNTNKE